MTPGTISGYGMRMMTYTRSNRRGVYWKTMEKKWNDALSEGKKVEVDIKINYADNLRPTDFDVTYIIKTSDGKIEKTENLFFLN